MLQEIYINNFVLIDELRLEFDKGLNVLTGETGAGKSIIIDALGLIMGERFKSDFVRDEGRKAIAEAVFDISASKETREFLTQQGFIEPEETSIIISREISSNGRSSARLNSRNVNTGIIKELSGHLLDMHLQHEHFTILRPEMYLSYVDSFTPQTRKLLDKIGSIYISLKEKRLQMEEILADEQSRLQKIDFLNYQINEIEKAALQPGEEEELETLRNRIRNAQNLLEGANHLLQLLYESDREKSAYDTIAAAVDIVSTLQSEDFFASLLSPLEDIYYSLEDIASRAVTFRNTLDFQPGRLDEVEERLHIINQLKSKYGQDINEIMAYLNEKRDERGKIENREQTREKLDNEINSLQEEYYRYASHLTEMRKQAAKVLQDKVNNELLQLNMPDIQFEILIEKREVLTLTGVDRVEFMFSPNPGEPLRPLSRIASGGEISRFILALKTALAGVYQVPTLIFDEIDVGVGGTSLAAMARKLNELSTSHQVILVTHSPQVASYADQHYLIEKMVASGNTFTRLKKLDNDNRIKELARMLGGENYSEITYQHAGEMLGDASKQKEK
ncbi:MAG: DNA repair protein RecN [Syntrophomonadaceae bacterium]|nr:DNA repair protein RecN [Syntrophomonadaceae bacterium]MDD3888496.1 DNA repair protein RecN [Syntrophomonadaceae bacterium]MDD4548736.1 DNA repair protein RecN [Syntrophomonadaceae bacterium]